MDWLIALALCVLCFWWGYRTGCESTTRSVAKMIGAGVLRWGSLPQSHDTEIAP